jgi:hypothetical protein
MRLKRAIEDFSMKSSEQSEKMIRLTKWIMGLTMVMGLLAFIQVIILIK